MVYEACGIDGFLGKDTVSLVGGIIMEYGLTWMKKTYLATNKDWQWYFNIKD